LFLKIVGVGFQNLEIVDCRGRGGGEVGVERGEGGRVVVFFFGGGGGVVWGTNSERYFSVCTSVLKDSYFVLNCDGGNY